MTKRFEILTPANYVQFRSKDVTPTTMLDPTNASALLQGEWLQKDPTAGTDRLMRLAAPGATGIMVFPVFDMEGSYDMRALGQVSVPWASTFEFATQLYDAAHTPATVGAACYVGLIAYLAVNRMIIDDNTATGTTIMARVTETVSNGWIKAIRIWA
ncbi:MAG: hypothetical protein ABIK45_07260 [Pseudomonadota bacterium]